MSTPLENNWRDAAPFVAATPRSTHHDRQPRTTGLPEAARKKHRLLHAWLAVASIMALAVPSPVGAQGLTNPVINQNFADPFVLNDGSGTYYAYATNLLGSNNQVIANVQCASSSDLMHWTMLPDALPTLPTWANSGLTWAPVVHKFGSTYVLYFTAQENTVTPCHEAIGVATSSSPTGPFVCAGSSLLVYEPNLGGDIDPAVFVDDDGTPYLLWKNDGNAITQPTHIWIQQLAANGLSLMGSPVQLIGNDQPWEGTVVEAPAMLKHDGMYYLFYSANYFGNGSYATGYAIAVSPTGPFVKPRADAWYPTTSTTSTTVVGPGGLDMVTDKYGQLWMSYHSWINGTASQSGAYRAMSLQPVVWANGVPYLTDTATPAQTYTLQNVMSGLMLDNASGSSTNGNKVQQWYANGQTPQEWTFAPTGDGYYYLINVACSAPPYMVLTDANSSTANGNTVYLYASSGLPAQQWKIVRNADGSVELVNRLSGAALDMGLSMDAGTATSQWQPSGSSTQRWFLHLVQ